MNKLVILLAVCALWACRPKAPPTSEARPASQTAEQAATVAPKVQQPPPSFARSTFDAPGRIVALGDVHGDFDAMQTALRAAKVVDPSGSWVGGNTTLVQTGDLLDRGDDEQRILDYFEHLRDEASAAGGAVVSLHGNHEVMNVAGDLRYVTPGGFADFADVEGLDLTSPVLERVPEPARPRMAAFMPGGPYARVLAKKQVVAVVDDTVFAHGGVLEHHVVYGLDKLNERTAAWMRGEADPPLLLQGDDSPIWTRVFSDGAADCRALQRTLDLLGAARMVVGHTPQMGGITSDCDQKVWRVDVGMAAHYGGSPAALEIVDGNVTPLASR